MGVWVLQDVTKAVNLTGAALAPSVRGIHNAYGNASTMAFSIDDELGTIDIDEEDEVYLTDDGVKVFAGYCRQVGQTDKGLTTQRLYAVNAQDYSTNLDDDVVDAGYRDATESDKARITWLFANFGTRGISVGASVVQLRATMPAAQDFTGMTLHEALTEIAKVTGGQFYVDFDKVLHYFSSEVVSAPFGLSDTPNYTTTFEYEEFNLPRDSVDKCNAVFVVGEGISGWRYQGGSPPAVGTRRAVTIRDPEITSQAQIDAVGDAYLAAHQDARQLGSLVTYRPGLRAGMTVQVTNAGWGYVATSFRISRVEFTPETKDRVRYTVHFGGTPVTLGEYFARSTGAISAVARAVSDVDAVLVDLSAGGGNLVPNSSFEDGTSWSVGAQWVIGYDPTPPEEPFAGTKTARIALAAQTAGNLLSPYIAVARTDDYWFSAWRFLRSRTSGTARIYLEEVNAASAVVATHTFDVTAVDTEWTRVSIHFANTAGPGRTAWNAATVKVRVGANSGGASGTLTLDVDGFQLERGKLISAYAPRPYELIDGSITSAAMADLAITTAKLAALAVDNSKLAALAVDGSKIAAGSVSTAKLAALAVTANEIAALAVTTAKLDALSVTAAKIAAAAVEADKIAANAIVAGKIAAGVVTATEIAAGAIDTAHLAATASIKLVSNTGATVVINASGLAIENGALILKDSFGQTVMTATGFSGSWLSFIRKGLYNADFAVGSTSDIAVSEVSGGDSDADYAASLTANLPYWVIKTSGPNLRCVTDADASSGRALDALGTGAGQVMRIYQDVPIEPGFHYTISFRALGNGFLTNPEFSWRNATHAIIGTESIADGENFDATASYATFRASTGAEQSDSSVLPPAPPDARYLRVQLVAQVENTENIRIADVAVTKGDSVVHAFTPVWAGLGSGAVSGAGRWWRGASPHSVHVLINTSVVTPGTGSTLVSVTTEVPPYRDEGQMLPARHNGLNGAGIRGTGSLLTGSGSGQVWGALNLPLNSATNSDLYAVGSDFVAGASVTIEGEYLSDEYVPAP